MSTTRPYTGVQLELYDEAVRLVPAILKARRDGRHTDVFELYKGLIDDGAERGLSREETWATFSTAAMNWTVSLFEGAAVRLGIEPETLLDQAIHASAFWSSSGH